MALLVSDIHMREGYASRYVFGIGDALKDFASSDVNLYIEYMP